MERGKFEDGGGAGRASALRPALTIIVVLAVILTLVVDLCRNLADEHRYRARVVPIVLGMTEHPEAAAAVRSALLERAGGASIHSIFAPDLTLLIRQDFEANPWVESVRSVRRRFPDRVEVRLRVKEPYCSAERDGRYLLVGRDGRILPGDYDAPYSARPVITIRSLDGSTMSPRGLNDEWFAAAVAEGAAVIQDIEKAWPDAGLGGEVEITDVSVSNFGGRLARNRPDVVLATSVYWLDERRGNKPMPVLLNWGRSTRHALAIVELPVARKLENLTQLLRAHRGLLDVRTVDLRFDRVVWRSSRGPSADVSFDR